MTITPREQAVLDFVRSYQEENGYSPSNADIGAGLGVTAQAVNLHVTRLVEKRLLSRTPGRPRSIVIRHIER